MVREQYKVALFTQIDLTEWVEESFSGATQYTIKEERGEKLLQACADMSISALYKRVKIDLNEISYLISWLWRVIKVKFLCSIDCNACCYYGPAYYESQKYNDGGRCRQL